MFSVSTIAVDFSQNQKLANQGNAAAQYNLGVMYYKGEGVSQDRSEATEWFQKAANQGHIKAQFNLKALRTNGKSAIQAYNNDMETNTANSMQPEFEVPYGYRLPTKADITGDWKRFNAPNHLEADFNGDGIKDEAYILPKEGSKLGYGVFVSINKANGGIQTGRKFQMFKLTSRDDMQPQSFAIELENPSNEIWETACGKGYWECEIGEPAEFQIKNPSIMFCYIESACTMYMWDSDKLSFKEIQFSD